MTTKEILQAAKAAKGAFAAADTDNGINGRKHIERNFGYLFNIYKANFLFIYRVNSVIAEAGI